MVFGITAEDEEGEETASVGNGNVEVGEAEDDEVVSTAGDDDDDANELDVAFDNMAVDEVKEGKEGAFADERVEGGCVRDGKVVSDGTSGSRV